MAELHPQLRTRVGTLSAAAATTNGLRLGLPHRSRTSGRARPSSPADRTASSPSRSARVALEHYVHAYSSSYVPLVYCTSSIVPLGTNLPFDAACVR
jgi:hypothetical protein